MGKIVLAWFLGVAAQAAPLPDVDAPPVMELLTDGELLARYPGQAQLEVRLDADFNGDGVTDTAYVARIPDEWRQLGVMIGYSGDTDMGYAPVGVAFLDVYPLGRAALSAKKGVLIVEDLSGGTSAIASTYRYRYDAAENRMRLIGDDVTYYSRTNQHDKVQISTNRLTGQRLRTVFRLSGEDYEAQPAVRETVPKAQVYMEEAPAPDVTLGLGEAG